MVKVKTLNFVLLLVLGIVVHSSFIPFINLNVISNIAIYTILAILILFNNKLLIANIIRYRYLWLPLIIMLIYLLSAKIFVSDTSLWDVKSYILGMLMFLVFLSTSIESYHKTKLMISISIVNIVTAYIIILYFYQGNILLALQDVGVYFYARKNAFSPLSMISSIYLFYSFLFSNEKRKWLNFVFFLLSLLSIVIIQSRTNILALLVTCLILVLYKNKRGYTKKNVAGIIFGSTAIVLLISMNITKISETLSLVFRLDYLKYSNGNSFLDKLTSGRFSSIEYGSNSFYSNPFIGALYSNRVITQDPNTIVGMHIIWLRLLFYGGLVTFLIFCIMLLFFYLYFKNEIKNSILIKVLIVAGLIVSSGEPFAPFGPGTTYFNFWLLLSLSIQSMKQLSKGSP